MLTPDDLFIGNIVECCDADQADALTQGALYTIAYIAPPARNKRDDFVGHGVRVLEAPLAGGRAFDVRRFRAIPSDRIEAFRAMLKTVEEGVGR